MSLHTQSHLAPLLLILWLLANGSGLHSHFCFDGQEPPATVKFELGPDLHAETDQQHVDVDDEPTKSALVKIVKLDGALLLAALLWLLLFTRGLAPRPHSRAPTFIPTPSTLRPPLRAPPAHFALAF